MKLEVLEKLKGLTERGGPEPAVKSIKEDNPSALKAKLAKAHRKIKELEEEVEEKKKKREKEKIRKIEEIRRDLKKKRREEIIPLSEIPKNGEVFTKDTHTFIGYFQDYAITKGGWTMLISTERDGNGTVFAPPITAKDLSGLYHKAESMWNIVPYGIHILNITEEGDHVPDMEAKVSPKVSKEEKPSSEERVMRMFENKVENLDIPDKKKEIAKEVFKKTLE